MPPKAHAFLYQWAITYILVVAQSTNQNAAMIIDHQLDFTKIVYTEYLCMDGSFEFDLKLFFYISKLFKVMSISQNIHTYQTKKSKHKYTQRKESAHNNKFN